MNILSIFEKRSNLFWIAVGILLIGVIGIIDYATGYEVAVSLFYLVPISIVTWRLGSDAGIVGSFISAIVWFFADFEAGKKYFHVYIFIWNAIIGFCFFMIVTFLLATLRRMLEHEKELAHTDHLTGAVNSRSFFEMLQMEIDRSSRDKQPFTLAYIDLDNFKMVNDEFGHDTGDKVLQAIVKLFKSHLRKTDVVARLGGDEFALLLPETNLKSAQVALSKIQHDVLIEMKLNDWPVTLSIGALTCIDATPRPRQLIKLADELMYSVKCDNKNCVKYAIFSESSGGNITGVG